MLDDASNREDPYDYCNRIAEGIQDLGDRMQFYDRFCELVSRRPPHEQDALVNAGYDVFKYRKETARTDIARLRDADGNKLQFAPFIEDADLLAEVVHCPGEALPVKYLVYRVDAQGQEQTELTDEVTIGTTTYRPPQTRLIEGRKPTLLLANGFSPTASDGTLLSWIGPSEYGDTFDLFREVFAFIGQFLHLDDRRYRAIAAYYVMLTWLYDRFDVVPYLRALGEYGSGKSTLLRVLGSVSYRSIFAGGATTASPIFRLIERWHGTLVVDEADFGDSDMHAEIMKIFNCGYESGIYVLRSERGGGKVDAFEVEKYDVFGPKILGTRRRFKDLALESRCLSHSMRPNPVIPARIPLIRDQEFYTAAQRVRNKLLLFRFRRYRHATLNPRERFAGFDPRLNQILLPLLAVADDPGMRAQVLDHARQYQMRLREARSQSWEGKIAFCVLSRWANRASEFVPLKSVTDQLHVDFEDLKLDSRFVGETIRDTFKLDTETRGGQARFIMTVEQAIALCDQYTLDRQRFRLPPREGEDSMTAAPSRSQTVVPAPGVPRTPVRELVAPALSSSNGSGPADVATESEGVNDGTSE